MGKGAMAAMADFPILASGGDFSGCIPKPVSKKREGSRRESFVSRSIELPGRAKKWCDTAVDVAMADLNSGQGTNAAGAGAGVSPSPGLAAPGSPSRRAPRGGTAPPPKSYAQATGSSGSPKAPADGTQAKAKTTMSKDEILEAIRAMPQAERRTPRENCLVRKISTEKLQQMGEQILDLQNTAVYLFTSGQNPWRDTMGRWIQENFVQKLGAHVTRLRAIDKGHFLVVFASEEHWAKIFTAMPFKLNEKYIQVSPWSTDYDPNNFRVRLKPVWVSIVGLSSIFEEEGLDALKALGRILHTSGQDNLGRSKFSDVRALILLNEEEDWLEAVLLEAEEGAVEVEFELYYEPMPSGCFTCHKTRHLARFCPMTCTTRTVSDAELEEALKEAAEREEKNDEELTDAEEEEIDVPDSQSRKRNATPQAPSRIPTANPYEVLSQPEAKEESLPKPPQNGQSKDSFDLNTTAAESEELKKGGKGNIGAVQLSGAELMDYSIRQKRGLAVSSIDGGITGSSQGRKEEVDSQVQDLKQTKNNPKKSKGKQGNPPEDGDATMTEDLELTQNPETEVKGIDGRFWEQTEASKGINSQENSQSTPGAKVGNAATPATTSGSAKAQARLKAKATKEAQRKAAEEAGKDSNKVLDV
ncbi:hypothetical protein R1sor_019622 [Riccia sorocarpa]|uniref:DUF4283 domain-containing protein n=1 Tax=Riccia sorocarpa TaxID=122646 RepID=A0ABD3IGV1_9MARC